MYIVRGDKRGGGIGRKEKSRNISQNCIDLVSTASPPLLRSAARRRQSISSSLTDKIAQRIYIDQCCTSRVFDSMVIEGEGETNQSPNFLTFKEPKNRFQGTNSARLCSLVGRYDNPYSCSVPSTHRLFKNSSTERASLSFFYLMVEYKDDIICVT